MSAIVLHLPTDTYCRYIIDGQYGGLATNFYYDISKARQWYAKENAGQVIGLILQHGQIAITDLMYGHPTLSYTVYSKYSSKGIEPTTLSVFSADEFLIIEVESK
jgi:hypothetical protein